MSERLGFHGSFMTLDAPQKNIRRSEDRRRHDLSFPFPALHQSDFEAPADRFRIALQRPHRGVTAFSQITFQTSDGGLARPHPSGNRVLR